MRGIIISFILLFIIVLGFFYWHENHTIVEVEFEKMRPTKGIVNVYYNGYKIGRVISKKPCKTSSGVCLKTYLASHDMYLPDNIQARMRQRKITDRKYEDYMELLFPVNPNPTELKHNSIIKGELQSGFDNYMDEGVTYSDMEMVKKSVMNTAYNLEKSTGILIEILETLKSVTQNSKKDLENASKYLNSSFKNIDSLTEKFNGSIDDVSIRSIVDNLDDTTYYIKDLSGNLSTTFPTLYDTANSISSTTKNVDEIIQGVNCTLKKNFGGLRLIFGKVIQ